MGIMNLQAKYAELTDSITHSMPAKSAPTFPKPFPLRHIPLPISLNISDAFCVLDRLFRMSGSSYANEEDIREKKAPIATPVIQRVFGRNSHL